MKMKKVKSYYKLHSYEIFDHLEALIPKTAYMELQENYLEDFYLIEDGAF